jgi:hypothetical protein
VQFSIIISSWVVPGAHPNSSILNGTGVAPSSGAIREVVIGARTYTSHSNLIRFNPWLGPWTELLMEVRDEWFEQLSTKGISMLKRGP